MQLLTTRARAYVYAGMWVAECPARCGNVERLFVKDVRLSVFHCSHCNCMADIEWATDEAEIMAVLERRPVADNRHWYPASHELAIRANIPHGQTVKDLENENREHGVT